jgi:MscS family membrane protein
MLILPLLLTAVALPGRLAAQQPPLQAPAGAPASAAATPPPAVATAATAAAATPAPTREAAFEKNLPAPLRRVLFLDVRVWQSIALPLLLAIAVLLAWLATAITRRVLRPTVNRSESTLDDSLLLAVRSPLLLALTVLFFAAGLPVLALAEPVEAFVHGLLKGLGVVALSWVALRLIDVVGEVLARRLEREGRRRAAAIIPLGRRAAKIFLSVIAVVMLLQNVGLNVTGLVAGLGVGGIAVALAAQKTLENVFGGVSVITDQPVRVGDLCRFRDGATGTIEAIGMRSTRIRTPERTLVSIPNADFAQRELENLSLRDRFRLYAVVGLGYETGAAELRRVLAALRQLVSSHPLVSPEALSIRFIGFGPSALNVEISAYVLTTSPEEFAAVREDLFLRALDAITDAGAALALPTQRIYVAGDADRPARSGGPPAPAEPR